MRKKWGTIFDGILSFKQVLEGFVWLTEDVIQTTFDDKSSFTAGFAT